MQKKSAGSENLIGVGGSIKDGAAKIWGQLLVVLLSNFKNGFCEGGCLFRMVCLYSVIAISLSKKATETTTLPKSGF